MGKIHLYTSGDFACGLKSNKVDGTEDPEKVTCAGCKKSKKYGYYLDGWKKAKAAARSRLTRRLVPLIELTSEL
jgi:hypothetical protein